MSDTKTILSIESDPARRVPVERALKFVGYDVRGAENSLQGVDIARAELLDMATDVRKRSG